jgi:uncharacterized protein with HEPN domain
MRPDEARLFDMVTAIVLAIEHLGDTSEDEFLASLSLQASVTYRLIILGEAAGNVSPEVQAAHPEIPWGALRGLRNIAAHAYFNVDFRRIWKTVREELPDILARLRTLTSKLPPNE